ITASATLARTILAVARVRKNAGGIVAASASKNAGRGPGPTTWSRRPMPSGLPAQVGTRFVCATRLKEGPASHVALIVRRQRPRNMHHRQRHAVRTTVNAPNVLTKIINSRPKIRRRYRELLLAWY